MAAYLYGYGQIRVIIGRVYNLTSLAMSRKRRVMWGRRVLSTFFVSWLVIVLQPCVMAAEVDGDCPHCPPAEQRELPLCDEIVAADCALDNQLIAEPRSLQVKAKDSSNDLPIALASPTYTVTTPTFYKHPIPHNSAPLNLSGPPRNVLFCVYLK